MSIQVKTFTNDDYQEINKISKQYKIIAEYIQALKNIHSNEEYLVQCAKDKIKQLQKENKKLAKRIIDKNKEHSKDLIKLIQLKEIIKVAFVKASCVNDINFKTMAFLLPHKDIIMKILEE